MILHLLTSSDFPCSVCWPGRSNPNPGGCFSHCMLVIPSLHACGTLRRLSADGEVSMATQLSGPQQLVVLQQLDKPEGWSWDKTQVTNLLEPAWLITRVAFSFCLFVFNVFKCSGSLLTEIILCIFPHLKLVLSDAESVRSRRREDAVLLWWNVNYIFSLVFNLPVFFQNS